MTGLHDVAVIGAGPYGLAASAHLRARGLDVRTLGRPMELWEGMPPGMLLRSSWEASTISDPDGALSLDSYEAAHGVRLARPIPLGDFVRYAHWFRRSAVPHVDARRVVAIRGGAAGFELELDDGDGLTARRVVIATGPGDHARRPPQFARLGAPLAVHSGEIRDLGAYRARRTVVVGSGQSAIELAALLHEAGADVEVIARAGGIRWLRRSGWLHARDGMLRRLLYPPTDVGPVGLSQLVARPNAFRRLPVPLGERIAYRCIRPAASGWLVERTRPVRITFDTTIASATASSDSLRLVLDDGSVRAIERLVLATGYDVRADRHPLLSPALRDQLQCRAGAPLLGPGFESSVPGLHFVGAFSAASFGPIMRFVSGTPFTGRGLAAHLARDRRPAPLRTEAASVPA